MRPDLLLAHSALSRRAALGLTGAAAVTAALGTSPAAAGASRGRGRPGSAPSFDDTMFDVAFAEGGGWAPSRYGAGDQRGTLNEVTPATTADALRLLAGREVRTYQLGEAMTNGFPAFVTSPPRVYEQRLTVTGYTPPPGFVEGGGILQTTEPIGPNRVSIHEERFPQGYTYQIVTQLDGLNHIGVGATFYNGFQGPELATPTGTTALGNETIGPVVTRGVLLDVLGLKLEAGERSALSSTAGGRPVLRDDYRITVEDLQAAMDRGGVRELRPGDAVLLRTGWNQVAAEPQRYLAREPGIYLRESRWLAAHRPAIIGSDTWGLEVLGNPVVTAAFPVHQELLVKEGIRIAEGVVTDGLAADGVFEFVYLTTPQNSPGATAGNAPPAALGVPRRGRR